MGLVLEEVTGKKQVKAFYNVARQLYRDDPAWICPPDRHIGHVFSPTHNTYFQHGCARRWVLKDETGKYIGRIAAFIDRRKATSDRVPVGGIGFFECINSQPAADALFATAQSWLAANGMQGMDGPINFGANDRYWGLLVEGFTETPFTTNYNKPYYRELMEQYGFRTYYEMVSSKVDLTKPLDPRFYRIAGWISSKEGLSFRHPTRRSLPEYAAYFREIYNDAWQLHEEYIPLTPAQAAKLAKDLRHVLISSFNPFAFVRGEPAGFIICTPDMNQLLKPFKGKLNLFRLLVLKWRSRNNFAWYRKRKILTRGHAIAIGIKQKFQQYGLESGMIMSSLEAVRKLGFESIELRWAGDFNEKVIRLHKAVGAVPVRKHITYRYFFDKQTPVKSYTAIPLSRAGRQSSMSSPGSLNNKLFQ